MAARSLSVALRRSPSLSVALSHGALSAIIPASPSAIEQESRRCVREIREIRLGIPKRLKRRRELTARARGARGRGKNELKLRQQSETDEQRPGPA